MGAEGGTGGGSSSSDAQETRAHPKPCSSTPCLWRGQRKCPPDQRTPPLTVPYPRDDRRVSGEERGGDRGEHHRQVPRLDLSANPPQRSPGLLINPRPSSLPGPAPPLPASLPTLPASPHDLHSRVPSEVALRPLLPRPAPDSRGNRKRAGGALADTRAQDGRARTAEAHISVMTGRGERVQSGRSPHAPPAEPDGGGKRGRGAAPCSPCYNRSGLAPSYRAGTDDCRRDAQSQSRKLRGGPAQRPHTSGPSRPRTCLSLGRSLQVGSWAASEEIDSGVREAPPSHCPGHFHAHFKSCNLARTPTSPAPGRERQEDCGKLQARVTWTTKVRRYPRK